MAILKVAQMGNPVLRKRASDVDSNEIASSETQLLIDDMIETMYEYEGAGLAAPQVHVSRRVVVFEVNNNSRYPDAPNIPLTIAINPEIEVLSDELLGNWEGCLSIPGLRGFVERPSRVKFRALDRYGDIFEQELEGFSAVVIQHECDHLDGSLFIDRIEDRDKLAFMPEYNKYHLDNS